MKLIKTWKVAQVKAWMAMALAVGVLWAVAAPV